MPMVHSVHPMCLPWFFCLVTVQWCSVIAIWPRVCILYQCNVTLCHASSFRRFCIQNIQTIFWPPWVARISCHSSLLQKFAANEGIASIIFVRNPLILFWNTMHGSHFDLSNMSLNQNLPKSHLIINSPYPENPGEGLGVVCASISLGWIFGVRLQSSHSMYSYSELGRSSFLLNIWHSIRFTILSNVILVETK